MTRKSGVLGSRFVQRASRGVAASTFFAIWLCATAVGQGVSPEPPDLLPLAPIPRDVPVREVSSRSKPDRAIQRASKSEMGPRSGSDANTPRPSEPLDPFTSTYGSSNVDPDNPALGVKGRQKEAAEVWRDRAPEDLKQYQESMTYWNTLYQRQSIEAEACFQRGYSIVRRTSRDGATLKAAMAEFRRALELKPSHVEARYWRGCTAGLMNDRDAAISDFSWVIDHQPDHARASFARGFLLAERGNLDQAIADFDRAISLPLARSTGKCGATAGSVSLREAITCGRSLTSPQ